MDCKLCNIKMKVTDTTTTPIVTFRRLRCPKCGKAVKTIEREISKDELSPFLYAFHIRHYGYLPERADLELWSKYVSK